VEDRLVQVPVADVSPSLRDGRFHVQLGRKDLAGYPTIDMRAWQDRYRDTAARGTPQPLRRASEVLEAGLLDASGRRVGEVEDVVVNITDGSLRYGVAEFDTSWVQQGKLVALPIDAVQPHPGGGNDLVLRIQRSDLARAPAFDRDRWPDLGDRGFVQRVKDFIAAA
jgi:sporulation protein YlmC with PRC-barrel domain